MPKQLTDESRQKLHKHLNDKITKAADAVRKIQYNYTEDPETKEITWGEKKATLDTKDEKAVQGYWDQIKNCQLSLRLVFNTGWISEWRDEHIRVAQEKVDSELMPKIEEAEKAVSAAEGEEAIQLAQKHLDALNLERDQALKKIKDLKRAKGCNKKDCWGRGYCGFNVSTGEYSFCKCTLDTIQYYNVDKVSD
nr:hypothetical protein [uncultured Flavobacterium sp.]